MDPNTRIARSRWTLRAKWTLAVLAVAIVPMVVLGLVVLDIQRRGLSRAEKELEAAVVDEGASSIIQALDQASDTAERAKRIFADETLDVEARSRLLGDVAAAAPLVESVAFFDEQRRFVDAIVPHRSAGSAERAQTPPELSPGAAGFLVVTSAGGATVLGHQIPLDGSVHGFVLVTLARGVLDQRLRDLSLLRFGAADRVYVVDESLRVLGGPRASAEQPALPIFAAAGIDAKSFTTALLLTTEFRDGGTEKVGTIRTMPAQRWALVVERPRAEAFAALESARRAFLVSLAGFALVAALAGIVVVRQVLGPIGSLIRLVQRYARREFGARSDVKSGDELEALGTSLERMADDLSASEAEIEKRARIEANLRRYMPDEAAEAATNDSTLDLGGAKTQVTILFADVVAFTSFAERTSPERAVAFLNELFTILSEVVFRHDGMVDKFIGDCVMAVFRPSKDGERDDVARALAAAEDMHAFVESNLPRWRDEWSFPVELGIGVATGEVLIGNLGSSTRMEYTVIGDAVNVAARLESIARPRQTLATREIVDACPDVRFASLGSHALRGKAHPVEVFEVVP